MEPEAPVVAVMKLVHAEFDATIVTLGPDESVVHVLPVSVEKYNLAAPELLTIKRVQLMSQAI